ncbi:MAG TPA: metalloregulator ArsR/SmtB family transcription factor [Solirubrobacteraceae bacterium]|nr:metalloregulator ArsR/SmtB family transcription factor [Solirubrobacteraceae bacterium]
MTPGTLTADRPPGTAAERAPALEAPFRIPRRPTERQLLAKYFRAFGDPTRLHILELLSAGELSVSEIVTRIGTSQPRTSAHLACLRWCGFVRTRREHRTVYYRLADERTEAMLKLARAMLADNAEHVAACQTLERC